MTICPIAIVSGCIKCPIFKICPVKSLIGDYVPPSDKKATAESKTKRTAKSKTKPVKKPAAKTTPKRKA